MIPVPGFGSVEYMGAQDLLTLQQTANGEGTN